MKNKNILIYTLLFFLLLSFLFSCNKVNCIQLLKAVMEGDYKIVERYIKQGGNINVDYNKFDSYIETKWIGLDLLTIAIVRKHRDIFHLLVKAGIDINKKSNQGNTPIMTAVDNGDIQFVKYLIDAGADLNKVNDEGITALMIACMYGYNKIAELLITSGADINFQMRESGISIIDVAILKENIEMVRLLLEAGINPNIKNKQGLTPKDIAIASKLIDIVKLIEKYEKTAPPSKLPIQPSN